MTKPNLVGTWYHSAVQKATTVRRFDWCGNTRPCSSVPAWRAPTRSRQHRRRHETPEALAARRSRARQSPRTPHTAARHHYSVVTNLSHKIKSSGFLPRGVKISVTYNSSYLNNKNCHNKIENLKVNNTSLVVCIIYLFRGPFKYYVNTIG